MATKRAGGKKQARVVTVLVNGQVVGSCPEDQTVGQASEQIAKAHGLRSFSMKLNGKKLSAPDLNKSLKGAKQIELYAKDSRG